MPFVFCHDVAGLVGQGTRPGEPADAYNMAKKKKKKKKKQTNGMQPEIKWPNVLLFGPNC